LLLRSSKSLTEAIQLHDESIAGNADTVRVANRILERITFESSGTRVTSASRLPDPFYPAETAFEEYILLIEEDLRQPGSLDTETYTNIIGELGEAYRQVDRHQETEYCLRRLNKKRR
jgi:hypothetical protein